MRASGRTLGMIRCGGVVLFWSLVFLVGRAPAQQPGAGAEGIDPADVAPAGKMMPQDFTLRARLTKITPTEPTGIDWTCGKDNKGKLCDVIPVGQWSAWTPVASFNKGKLGGRMYLKFEAGRRGQVRDAALRGSSDAPKTDYSRDAELEIEFGYRGKVVKTIAIAGPEGGVFTVMIPGQKLSDQVTPGSKEFLDDLVSVGEYAKMRLGLLESQPWSKWPVPTRYLFITDCRGYGIGVNGWTTDLDTFATELGIARQLGVNGLRQPNQTTMDSVTKGKGVAREFGRGFISVASGYPVTRARADGRPDAEAGCPFAPGVAKRMAEGLVKARERNVNLPVPEVWAVTVDEINPAIMFSDAVRQHPAVCEYCAEGYRQYIKSIGLSPADFGKKEWSEIRPLDVWGPQGSAPKGGWTMPDLTDKHNGLAAYHTMQFVNWSSARLFESMRDQFDALNQEKREAVSKGDKSSPATTRPFIYSYGLRGQNFLAAGHPLEYFDFYRHADNGFVYETSSRGPQIWSWDDYLLNVGRVVSGKMNKQLGVYVKPHRGAPMQRALSAVTQGARMIYWYTYGPEYEKGDSFSMNLPALVAASKAAHLIGKTEEVLWESSRAFPAEVAVVKPDTSLWWMRLKGSPPDYTASWENAKWVYTALAHAHVPVDAIDEVMLATEDLSHYKAIYVHGPNVTQAAAKGLEKYVREGGVLYTSGGGLARDEADQPLTVLQPILGLEKRNALEMYYKVPLYGGGALESFSDESRKITPVTEGATITPPPTAKIQLFAAGFRPSIGRELMLLMKGAEAIVKFADGNPAVVVNSYGKGKAYTIGFFPGLEYSSGVRKPGFDMSREFDAGLLSYVAGPVLTVTKPVVAASNPVVQGALLKNKSSGKLAVVLMNWAYRASGDGDRAEPVALENVKVTIRGQAKKVSSAMLDKVLSQEVSGGNITVTLPRLEEGDVLLLE